MAEISMLDGPIYYSNSGSTDAKLQPVGTYTDLRQGAAMIPVTDRYVGMTIAVTGATSGMGTQVEYWLVGGVKNANWKLKTGNVVPTIEDLNAISSGACIVGTEMIVQSDSTNENKVTKYWVTAIDKENKRVVWERKQYGGGSAVTVEGEDQEPA
jgi:hypothetical protein